MKVLIAPDKFRGSLDAYQAAELISEGVKEVDSQIETIICPIADGGEGTYSVIASVKNAKKYITSVKGPYDGKTITSYLGIYQEDKINVGLIEMAAASGLSLVPPRKRNPLKTTTYGTGQLIKKALEFDCKKIYIGLGGSATNDGGIGVACALGARFLDQSDKEVEPIGKNLLNIKKIDLTNLRKKVKNVQIIAITDVDSPFFGQNGAALVFGPQKGANLSQAKYLDKGLMHLADLIKEQLNIDISNVKGAGAAGGLGGGLYAFLGAKILPGFETIFELVGLKDNLVKADVIITGEGKLDSQSLCGKGPVSLAKMAKMYNKEVFLIVGQHEKNCEAANKYADKIISLVDCVKLNENKNKARYAMENAAELIKEASKNLTRQYYDKKYS